MKLTLIGAIALTSLSATAAFAEDNCAAFGALAETIMTARQDEMPVSGLIAALPDNEAKELSTRLILLAYDSPGYQTREFKDREIARFRNNAEVACYLESAGE